MTRCALRSGLVPGATLQPSMPKQPSRQLSAEITLRQGEGFALPTDRRQIVKVDGTTISEVAFKLSDAPAPERRYIADIYGVLPTIGGYKLLFGQEKIGGAGLRSLLVVQMTDEAVRRFVDITAEFPTPGQFVSEDASLDRPSVIEQEPDQTLAVRANVVSAALSNGESCMDFYQISPFASHAVQSGGKLQMSQVVRVELRTGQLMALLSEFERLGFARRRKEVVS